MAQERSSSALYAGMKALLTCDNGDVVAGIVEFVVSQRRGLRWLAGRLARPGANFLAIPLIVLNGLRCYVGVYPSGRGPGLIAVRRPNERRAVADFKRMMPERQWTELVFAWGPGPVASAIARLSPTFLSDCRRTIALARLLVRRYGVFRALRAVELLAFYRRYCELLAATPLDLTVISSHSNPWGIALNAAARRFGVPIALVTHGMPVPPVARLDYHLAIVECDASRRMYEQAGCRLERVIIKSRKRDFVPVRRRLPLPAAALRIGICLSKDPVEARVVFLVKRLLADPRVSEVLIRPHPINLWRRMSRQLASFGDTRLRLLSGGSLAADLRQFDLVYGGNSTVLLDALIAGCPACYVRGLDHGPYDVQAFVRDGLVYEAIEPGLGAPPARPAGAERGLGAPASDGVGESEGRSPSDKTIDDQAIARFYERPSWPDVLRRYADIDRGEAEVAAATRAEVQRLAGVNAYERGLHEDRGGHSGPNGIFAISRKAAGDD